MLLPQNARYWFKGLSDEAHLLQIAGYPRGAKAAKRVPVEKDKRVRPRMSFGMTEEDLRLRALKNQQGDAPMEGSESKFS